jgi:hypothetical protein
VQAPAAGLQVQAGHRPPPLTRPLAPLQVATRRLVQLVGRRSLIVFSMAALLGASSAVMCWVSGLDVVALLQGRDWAAGLLAFGSICPSS